MTTICLFSVLGLPAARASIVWDYSPAIYGADSFQTASNRAAGQNYVEEILFSQSTALSGMDIYSSAAPLLAGNIGDSMTIRLYADNTTTPGQPDLSTLIVFVELLSEVDFEGSAPNLQRLHVDFTSPVLIPANSVYWIGMSGTTKEFTQGFLDSIPSPLGDGTAYQMNGTAFAPTQGARGDMAFRLYAVIPEPAALLVWSMLGLAVSGIASRRLSR